MAIKPLSPYQKNKKDKMYRIKWKVISSGIIYFCIFKLSPKFHCPLNDHLDVVLQKNGWVIVIVLSVQYTLQSAHILHYYMRLEPRGVLLLDHYPFALLVFLELKHNQTVWFYIDGNKIVSRLIAIILLCLESWINAKGHDKWQAKISLKLIERNSK